MAKKRIVLSDNSGSVYVQNTSSVFFEDSDRSLNVTNITASNFSLESAGAGIKLYNISGSTFKLIPSASLSNTALRWSGSEWVSSSFIAREFSGSFNADLTGSFPNPTVINIGNVSSGSALPIARGGTGLSIPAATNVIFEASGSQIYALTGSTGLAGAVLSSVDGKWMFSHPTNFHFVRFYKVQANTPKGGQATYTWQKPTGHQWARVICQGAGSGGSSGHAYNGGIHYGVGGGSGGFSDQIINLSTVTDTVTVSVGAGGAGGLADPVFNTTITYVGVIPNDTYWQTGGAGGNSSFGSYASANGGSATGPPYGAAGAGGAGSTFNGTSGGVSGVAGTANTNASSGGGGGSVSSRPAGGAITLRGISNTNRHFEYYIDSIGTAIDASFSAGTAGSSWNGANTIIPEKPGYGGGGGGGGGQASVGHGSGGDGGDGFVLVISW